MSFLAPTVLLLFLVLPPLLVWLHSRYARRRVVRVGSLVLWRRLSEERAARSTKRNRSIPISWELLVALLTTSFLILALSRPQVHLSRREGRGAVVVLDGSASTRGKPFELLRAETRALLGKFEEDDEIALIQAPDGRVVFSGTVGLLPELSTGLEALVPVDRGDRWDPILAQALVQRSELIRRLRAKLGPDDPDPPVAMIVLAHSFPPALASALQESDEVSWTILGGFSSGNGSNVGIVRFGESLDDAAGNLQLLVEVAGTSFPDGARLVIAEEPGGKVRLERGLPPGAERMRLLETLPSWDSRLGVRASLELPGSFGDGFGADDEVLSVRPQREVFRVTMQTPSPRLRRAFRAFGPGVEVRDRLSREESLDSSSGSRRLADLTVKRPLESEEVLLGDPQILVAPRGDVVLVEPIPSGGGVRPRARVRVGERYRPRNSALGRDAAPLQFGAESFAIEIPTAFELKLEPEEEFSVLAVAEFERGRTPLIVRMGEVLVLGFDPEQGSWPETPSFPIFWTQELARFGAVPESGLQRVSRVEESLRIPVESDGVWRLVGPDVEKKLEPIGGWLSVRVDRVGTYRLRDSTGEGERQVRFDLLSEGETLQAAGIGQGQETAEIGEWPGFGEEDVRSRTGARDLTGWLIGGSLGGILLLLLRPHRWRGRRENRSYRSASGMPMPDRSG